MNYFWFRRDLRLKDNAGLYHSLKNGETQCLFIFDKAILEELHPNDKRVLFIHQEIERLQIELGSYASSLRVEYGETSEIWAKILDQNTIDAIYTNRDYEPYAKSRDKKNAALAASHSCTFHDFKDQCIFEMVN